MPPPPTHCVRSVPTRSPTSPASGSSGMRTRSQNAAACAFSSTALRCPRSRARSSSRGQACGPGAILATASSLPSKPTASQRSCSRSATTRRPQAACSSRCRRRRRCRSRRSSARATSSFAASARSKKGPALSSVSLPRRFAFELTPEQFVWVARAAVACLIGIVATGATVRLTGSGLGCPHWPTCTTTHALPRGYHSDIEFANRVVSAVTIFATLALAVVAFRTPRAPRRLALAVFLGTLAQAPLGAVTVYYDLNPYLVISHLLLSLTVLGLGVLTLLFAHDGGASLPAIARAGGAALLVAIAVLVVTGTLSTAAGRFPGSNGATVVRRLGNFHDAVWLHVRAVAAFGILFLLLAAWAWTRRRAWPWLVRGCAGLLAILLVQMGLGELQYRTYGTVPWWVVVLHVALAAALFGWTVGLVARLWRPVEH